MIPHLDSVSLLPEYAVGVTIVCVLIFDLVISDRHRSSSAVISVLGCVVGLVSVIAIGATHATGNSAGGRFVVDEFSLVIEALVLGSTILVLLMGLPDKWKGEYCVLLLAAVLGMMMIASARDLITFFIAFELLAIPGYILVGWNKSGEHGHEAAFKYYLFGVIATALLLYGMSFLYGMSASTKFSVIAHGLSGGGAEVPLARIGIILVILGIAFKISAVPLHFWAPDAYQGAPIPVAAFLSVTTKIAGFASALVFVLGALGPASSLWGPAMWTIAALTMTVGNLMALRQDDIVRLLAYSSIAQGGYGLIPLVVALHYGGSESEALASSIEFLAVYAVTNLAAFAVVTCVQQRRKSTSISAYRGLMITSPWLAVALIVAMVSLAGVPPLGGWFAKLVVLRAAVGAGGPWAIALAVVAAVNTAIGLVYYGRIVRVICFMTPVEEHHSSGCRVTAWQGLAVIGAAGAVVVLGVFPGLVTSIGGLSSLAH